MANTSNDLRDVMLEAAADVQSLVMEFEEELAEPQMMMKFKQLWMKMPDEMKAKFAADRPEVYAAFMSALNQGGK